MSKREVFSFDNVNDKKQGCLYGSYDDDDDDDYNDDDYNDDDDGNDFNICGDDCVDVAVICHSHKPLFNPE